MTRGERLAGFWSDLVENSQLYKSVVGALHILQLLGLNLLMLFIGFESLCKTLWKHTEKP